MPQRQVDWAERKASQFDWLDRDTIVQIAHALRLERARAVRVCQRLAKKVKCCCPYDCANAIKGKPYE